MLRQLAERIGSSLLTLLAISIIVFAITEILPGDVIQAIYGQSAVDINIDAARRALGLDRPAAERYVAWLGGVLSGDLGTSFATGREITATLGERLPSTFLLAGITILLAVPIGVGLGIYSAVYQTTWKDRVITSVSTFLVSVPEFLLGTGLVILLSVHMQWFPAISYAYGASGFWSHIQSLTLPVLTLLSTVISPLTRMTRSATVEVLGSPPIEMALLKGLPRRTILLRHAFPHALGPILAVIALCTAYLVTSAIIVEVVFNYPGMGKLLVDAVGFRDMPMVQASVLCFCATYVALNTLSDIFALTLNPLRRLPK